MHKYISAIILAILSTSALAKGKWNVGVAGGWGIGRTRETITQSTNFPTLARYKFTLKGSGPTAGILAGYNIRKNKNIFSINIGGYKDFYQPSNSGIKSDTLSDIESDFKSSLKRKYTLEVAGKIGHFLTSDMNLYGKVGLLRSEFQEQYIDHLAPNIDIRNKYHAWGGVVGFGFQKTYESVSVGLEYNYQYYERLGKNTYFYTGLQTKNASKFRPQYHNILLSFTKTI